MLVMPEKVISVWQETEEAWVQMLKKELGLC